MNSHLPNTQLQYLQIFSFSVSTTLIILITHPLLFSPAFASFQKCWYHPSWSFLGFLQCKLDCFYFPLAQPLKILLSWFANAVTTFLSALLGFYCYCLFFWCLCRTEISASPHRSHALMSEILNKLHLELNSLSSLMGCSFTSHFSLHILLTILPNLLIQGPSSAFSSQPWLYPTQHFSHCIVIAFLPQ